MPTCPGCHQSVSYDRLVRHERYCPELGGSNDVERTVRRIEERLDAVEDRLDRRLRAVERRIGVPSGAGPDDRDGQLLGRNQ